jgi:RNA polymerase sigma factor (sigma-70 family)
MVDIPAIHLCTAMTQRTDTYARSFSEREAAWPGRLIELASEFIRSTGLRQESARTQLWLLLNTVIFYRIRREAKHVGKVTLEDIQDLSSEKSLELMKRLEDGRWRVDATAPEKAISFIATVARNSVIDLQRRNKPGAPLYEAEEAMDISPPHKQPHMQPDSLPEQREFVSAIVDCAAVLKDMHRRIWLFRVLLEMSTQDIARHPDVGLETGYIDVILKRSRDSVKACMEKKGFETSHLPPGVFSGLWRAFQLDTMTAKEEG